MRRSLGEGRQSAMKVPTGKHRHAPNIPPVRRCRRRFCAAGDADNGFSARPLWSLHDRRARPIRPLRFVIEIDGDDHAEENVCRADPRFPHCRPRHGRRPGARHRQGGQQARAEDRDRRLPFVDLGKVLGFKRDAHSVPMLAIVSISGGSYALAVDDVLDTEELVIKPAAPAVMAAGVYAGQTLPDSGLPMLLLDCAGIAAIAGLHFTRTANVEEIEVAEVEDKTAALLLYIQR
eukprot:gene40946-55339_t